LKPKKGALRREPLRIRTEALKRSYSLSSFGITSPKVARFGLWDDR
jgi:hypothetical protein